jgi:hypothetical protein
MFSAKHLAVFALRLEIICAEKEVSSFNFQISKNFQDKNFKF